VSKPEWIRGHYFNALSVLVGAGKACFALPLVLRLDDGIKSKLTPKEGKKGTKKEKTTGLSIFYLWIKTLETDTSLSRRELPIYRLLGMIALSVPSRCFLL
jgi:hypothetical protein